MITTEFDKDRNVMVMKLSGSFDVNELVKGYESALADPNFDPEMSSVWDINMNLTKIPVGDIRRLAGELRGFMDRRGTDVRSALVVRRSTDYHLLRIYLSILRLVGGNVRLRLFRNVDEAFSWFKEKNAA